MVHGTSMALYARESWSNTAAERSFDCSQPQPEPRIAAPISHRPHSLPLSIEESLRCCARVPVKDFALIAVLDDGQEVTFTSQNLTSFQPNIFSPAFKTDFHRCVRRASLDAPFSNSGAYNHDGSYSDLSFESAQGMRKSSSGGYSAMKRRRNHRMRQHISDESDDDSTDMKKSKRNHRHYDSSEDIAIPIQEKKTQALVIGDSDEVTKLYHLRFKDMQQAACKIMGKAFVKLVEPRKQTHYPYTKGAEKAPPWWPLTTGENLVRHKEPDHLLKPERISLLVHILKMIIEPYHNQVPAVQKLGLNVKKLEEVTMEAMSNWFNEKEHPENAAKRPFLKEIFKVARHEERFKNGELSGDTQINVMYGDSGAADQSDDDEEEDLKLEDDDLQPELVESPTILTPHSLVSPSMIQTQQSVQQHSEQHETYIPSRPVSNRFNNQTEEQSSSYVNGSSFVPRLTFNDPPSNVQDHTQRSMSVNSINMSQYPNSQHNGFNWQASFASASNTSPTSSYYTTSPQTQSFGSTATTFQLPPPNTQTAVISSHGHNMHSSFDGLPNRQFDTGAHIGNQLRTGSLGHPHQLAAHHAGYVDIFSDGANYGHNDLSLKDDSHMHQG
ncbi:hypothetical protein ACMFMG_008200 [Clarireedia jacksonii]